MTTPSSIDTAVLLSGGMESVTLLAKARAERAGSVRALTLRAGLQSEPQQLHYAKVNAFKAGVPHDVYDMRGVTDLMNTFYPLQFSTLGEWDTPCPMEESALPLGIAGAVFYCQMAGIATLQVGITKEQVVAGKASFLDSIGEIMSLYRDGSLKVAVEAPFKDMTKADVILYSQSIGVSHVDTWSCYYTKDAHCGECLGCQKRKAAFDASRQSDPTTYLK